MSDILVLIVIFFLTLGGYAILALLKTTITNFSLRLALGFGLGAGLIGQQLFLYTALGISWSLLPLIVPWIVVILFGIYKRKEYFIVSLPQVKKISSWEGLLLFMIVALVLFVGFEAAIRPITAWDGWSSWLMKSKMFYLDGGIFPQQFHYLHSEYPVLLSLVGTFVYIVLQGVNDRSILLLFWAFYAFTGLALFGYLKKITSIKYALLFVFLLLSTQNLVRHGGRYDAGDADLALAFYMLCSMVLYILYGKTSRIQEFVLLQLFLGTTALIKNEGIPFVCAIQAILLYQLFRRRCFSQMWIVLLGIFPLFDWQLYKFLFQLPPAPHYFGTTIMVHGDRLMLIFFHAGKIAADFIKWNLLWIAFFIVFLYYLFFSKKHMYTSAFVVFFFQIVVYLSVYFLTIIDPTTHINNTFDRLLLHLAPTAVLFIGIVLFEDAAGTYKNVLR